MNKEEVLFALPYKCVADDKTVTVADLYEQIVERIENVNIHMFKNIGKPLFCISKQYSGVWLEHVYDSVFLAMRDKKWLPIAENTINAFIDNQKENGLFPFAIMDNTELCPSAPDTRSYSHVQEVVSFPKLGFMVYEMNGDKAFLKKLYESSKKWVAWYQKYRNTLGTGLVEMFVGFDTGHDNSPRLDGMNFKGRQWLPTRLASAEEVPESDEVAPIVAVDMSSNLYASLVALSKMAEKLEEASEALKWQSEADILKRKLIELCYDSEDCFFYDVDKNGNKRKYKTCAIFHLFMEGVLDKDIDGYIIRDIYEKHISRPDEFATPYPYPSMAINDPSVKDHANFNCWGYYSQALIALRCTMWMDKYGYSEDFDRLCEAFVKAWCENYDKAKIAQEIDPITGVPTSSSEWYSSSMLFYLYAVDRLVSKKLKNIKMI